MSGQASNEFIGRAVQIVKHAIEEDRATRYARAYPLYVQAIEQFMKALKHEKSEQGRKALEQRLTG